jgi:hypothetical protein
MDMKTPADVNGLISDLLASASQLLSPLLDRIIEVALQASTLAELRDTVLPRLISGQLRRYNWTAYTHDKPAHQRDFPATA